jgi:hypothetical protein
MTTKRAEIEAAIERLQRTSYNASDWRNIRQKERTLAELRRKLPRAEPIWEAWDALPF